MTERIKYIDGTLSQKATRMRDECIGCRHLTKLPMPRNIRKWMFQCKKYGIRLTFSGYSNYNQYLNHVKGCPIREVKL